MKPLVRWTIGRVHPCGWEVLMRSIKLFPQIYPDFDMVVCHNSLTDDEVKILANSKAQLHKQSSAELAYPVGSSGWKLLPPRLRLGCHELWLDNDVMVTKCVPAIDAWLKSKTSIISQGLYGLYGRYRPQVKSAVPVCAGVFGLPPFFDFESEILRLCKQVLDGDRLDMPFDEQGLTATIATSIPDHIVIPMDQIRICETGFENANGFHFVGTNRGDTQAWLKYKDTIKRQIKNMP